MLTEKKNEYYPLPYHVEHSFSMEVILPLKEAKTGSRGQI